jgi:uncharacterized FAD-dependent dehydrogenase
MKAYNIGIIGAGVAGSFASLRLAEKHRDLKAILFEFGRPPGKRRRQLEGWFGCFPTGDGKVYVDDYEKVLNLADGRRTKAMNRWLFKTIAEINKPKTIKNKQPSASILKKITGMGFEIEAHDYQQWYPESIHQLSKITAEIIEEAGNVEFSFDNEVYSISKSGKYFSISTSGGDFKCEKVLLCAGRSGWRWVNEQYRNLGILLKDNVASYGIRVELPAQYLKEFNHSHCIMTRDDLKIGPLCWDGSVIQEDHVDLTTAAFRSNEDRWKTDKVFFSVIGNRDVADNEGVKQAERMGKLSFLLAGDRVGRERIKSFVKGESQLCLIPEYKWLNKVFTDLSQIFPSIISRGYFHSPDIETSAIGNIAIGSNLETEIDGLFVAGESAGIKGIAAAGISGALAIESACK